MSQPFWRRWHRWVGAVAAPFLVFVSVTGVALACVEWFGEDEERRERLREQVSPVKLPADPTGWSGPAAKALAAVAAQAPGAPVDKLTIEFKGEPPTVTVYLGKPGGGEDRKFVCDAATGAVLRVERYEDKPFLVRLHSGEAVGDWGLGLAILWGTGLLVLTASGTAIYLGMRKPDRKGIARVFW
ncbi:MAG: PepSY-associated TM helix domain-containing protein [Gemmataceae bacterium]